MVIKMNKEFIENIIFENEKDNAFGNSNYFYKKLNVRYNIRATAKDYSELYKRIINYQIKKYGRSLNPRERMYTLEDGIKAQQLVRMQQRQIIKSRRKKRYDED